MNHLRFRPLLVSLLLLWLAIACSERRSASTEVENEIRLSGIAATGMACANAPVTLYASNGFSFASGTTDSSGTFSLVIQTFSDTESILVQVEDTASTLFAIVDLSATDSLFTLVNPITHQVVIQLMGKTWQHPEQGFRAFSRHQIDSVGTLFTQRLFQQKANWNEFSTDPHFRPYHTPQTEFSTGPNDALLHTLGDEARRLNLSLENYLDSLYHQPPEQNLLDQDFRFQLATNLVLLGVDSLEAQEKIRDWQPQNPQELSDYYHALRQNPKSPPPPNESFPDVNKAAQIAVDHALPMVPEMYQGSNDYSLAMEHLPTLTQISWELTRQALAPFITANLPKDAVHNCSPYTEETARQSIKIITYYSPDLWVSDSAQIYSTAQSILNTYVNNSFDVIACAQSPSPKDYYINLYQPWHPSSEEWEQAIQQAEQNP